MDCAVSLMNWYLGEAERLQGVARLDRRLLRAGALLEWMQTQGTSEIEFRHILQFGPSIVRTKAAAEDAIVILR
jgi:hypothetical protein